MTDLPRHKKAVIDGKEYDTEKATLLATASSTMAREYLFRAGDGDYFMFHCQMSLEGYSYPEQDKIFLVSEDDAIDFFEGAFQFVSTKEAFPNAKDAWGWVDEGSGGDNLI